MAQLDNPRHEKFAQGLAKGMTGSKAYRHAYGDQVKAPRQQAHDLLKDTDISRRVKELQGKAASGDVMTLQQEMEYLTKAILTPIDQIDETSIFCQRVKHSETGRELWMVDKLRAMEMLIRLKGEFAAEKVELSGLLKTTSEEVLNAVRMSPALRGLPLPANVAGNS